MSRNAHRHPHVCARCGETTIETTLGFRWWDRVDQRIIPRGGSDYSTMHPRFREALRIANVQTRRASWEELYDQRLSDGNPRLMRTTTHEISCARKHGEQPSRNV